MALNGLKPILFGHCLVKTKNPARGEVGVEESGQKSNLIIDLKRVITLLG
jgi:hypothetical protein